ncbi:MAG: type 4a pilus biogenesis protein PilO [Candidatus Omnitrophota bacterium]|nr:type 4a pilus biogenesis protein PilO [Candidatus Omnitrophota bacterium]
MVNENKRRIIKIAINCIIIILVLILLYLFLGLPAINYSKRLRRELDAKEKKMAEYDGLVRILPNPQAAITEMDKKVQEFKDMGVSRRQLPRLIQLLGALSSDNNINVISLKPRDDVRLLNEVLPPGITKVYIEMVLNCTYRTYGDFLKSLNELPTFFSIESVNMERQQNEEIEVAITDSKKGSSRRPTQPADKPIYLTITMLLSTYMVLEL